MLLPWEQNSALEIQCFAYCCATVSDYSCWGLSRCNSYKSKEHYIFRNAFASALFLAVGTRETRMKSKDMQRPDTSLFFCVVNEKENEPSASGCHSDDNSDNGRGFRISVVAILPPFAPMINEELI